MDVDPDLVLLRAYEPVLRYTAGELFLPTAVEAVPGAVQPVGGRRGQPAQAARRGARRGRGADAGRARRGRDPASGPAAVPAIRPGAAQPGRRRGLAAGRPAAAARQGAVRRGRRARAADRRVRPALAARPRPGPRRPRRGGAPPRRGGPRAGRRGSPTAAVTSAPPTGACCAPAGTRCCSTGTSTRSTTGARRSTGSTTTRPTGRRSRSTWCPDGDGGWRPAWVGASSHDLAGADLRRRWDDPQLRREGDHPVIYPGAGSHSGAFLPGDYVVSVELPALRRVVNWLQHARRRLLPWTAEPSRGAFAIPFVDYARGDGCCDRSRPRADLAAGARSATTPRGCATTAGCGGSTRTTTFGGERAPAGPRYERTGTVRRSWTDPLGWVGLDGVPATADGGGAAPAVADRR